MEHADLPQGTFGRLHGIKEQYDRARMFLGEAGAAAEPRDRFRRLMASVYFARAMVEIMLEGCDREEVPLGREALIKQLEVKLAYYDVIYRLRIHDFHRFGVAEMVGGVGLRGSMSLHAQGDEDGPGGAWISLGADGPAVHTTGQSKVDWERSLLIRGEEVFDHRSGSYVSIADALSAYLDAAPAVIEDFNALQRNGTTGD